MHEYTNGVDYVWSVNCVFDASFHEPQAKSFVEKLVLLMEPQRSTSLWRAGSTCAAQESFAPMLLARLEQANSLGKTAMVSEQVDEVKDLMAANIELLCAAVPIVKNAPAAVPSRLARSKLPQNASC